MRGGGGGGVSVPGRGSSKGGGAEERGTMCLPVGERGFDWGQMRWAGAGP